MSPVAALLLVAALAFAPADNGVFVRDLKSIDDVVRAIHLRAGTEKHARLVFCLDDELFEKARWFDAIEREFRDPALEFVITGRSEPTRRMRRSDIRPEPARKSDPLDHLLDDLGGGHGGGPLRLPAIGDWLQSVPQFAHRGAAVVFITSRSPAECWAGPKSKSDLDDCVDACWHEEEVGACFAENGVALWIVAPEATFGCDAAVSMCRFLPYANRPTIHAGRQMNAITAGPVPESDSPMTPAEVEALVSLRPWPRFEGVLPSVLELDIEFDSRSESDIPSGSGFWSYARACFLSHGHYFQFADGHDDWRDRCERGPDADALLAPLDRSAKSQWDAEAATAPVKHLHEIVASALAASRDLFKILRPGRGEGEKSEGRLHPVEVFERPRASPTTLTNDFLYDDEHVRDEWRTFSKTLAAPIGAWDLAAAQLSRSLEFDAASWNALGPRARNDALIEWFWLKMSAFHLESLRVLTADPEHFLIEPKKGWRASVVPWSAIKLSDCLQAYDDRHIPPELEAASLVRGDHRLPLWPPQLDQSNELKMSPFDPNWRAERDLLNVIANLDPQLKTRALDLIAAAREIHDSLRGTPWDWLVYFANVDVYVFTGPSPLGGGYQKPKPSEHPDDAGPPTPRAPGIGTTGGAKPGSTGGGK